METVSVTTQNTVCLEQKRFIIYSQTIVVMEILCLRVRKMGYVVCFHPEKFRFANYKFRNW
jgi:hypothetical protein